MHAHTPRFRGGEEIDARRSFPSSFYQRRSRRVIERRVLSLLLILLLLGRTLWSLTPTEVHKKTVLETETELPGILLFISLIFVPHHGNSVHLFQHSLFRVYLDQQNPKQQRDIKAFYRKSNAAGQGTGPVLVPLAFTTPLLALCVRNTEIQFWVGGFRSGENLGIISKVLFPSSAKLQEKTTKHFFFVGRPGRMLHNELEEKTCIFLFFLLFFVWCFDNFGAWLKNRWWKMYMLVFSEIEKIRVLLVGARLLSIYCPGSE